METVIPTPTRAGSGAEEEDRSPMKSLQKALAILEAISQSEIPPRTAEVAIRVGIPRPTAHRLIQALIAEGYISQDPQSGRLGVGFSAVMLSASALDRSRLRVEALSHLQDLANLAQARANLGILHRDEVLYLAGVEKPTLPTIYTRFGRAAPAHCCSLGKAILAFLPDAKVQALLAAKPLVPHTPTSITTTVRLMEELEAIRRRKYALDCEEHVIGSFCVASTIFDGHGYPQGAISLSGGNIDALLGHVSALKHKAELISHRLS